MRRIALLVSLFSIWGVTGFAQLSGTKTVGGTSPDYTTLSDAITALNTSGVASPGVTFLIRSGTYGSTSGFTISTTTPSATAPVTFKPDAGATVIIERTVAGSVFTANAGVGYITLDGSNNGTTTRDMTIRNTTTGTSIAINFLGTNPGCSVKNLIVDAGANTSTNRTSTSSIGIRQHWGGSGESHNFTIANNLISNAGIGIRVEGNSTTPLLTGCIIRDNAIHTVGNLGILTLYNISPQIYGNDVQVSEGTGTSVYGISLTTSVVGNFRVYNNRVHNVKTSTTSTSTTTFVAGIHLSSSGTTSNRAGSIFNNFIYDINATAATGATPVLGILLAAASPNASPDTVAFNSVNLSGSNVANRMSAALAFVSTTTTHKVYVRNNIFSNTLTSGTAATIGILKSSSGTTLGSNNNNIYVGTPGAANLTGRISTTDYQSLTDWQSGSFQDFASVSENPAFVSATDLNIPDGTPTQMESAGIALAGITSDINGTTRNASTPDMGADEFAGILADMTGPSISYTSLTSTTSTANRTLVATITDAAGVATGTGAPKLYYRKGTSGAYTSAAATSVSGNDYTFEIDYTAVGGVVPGDVLQYYIAAQDANGNVSSNPNGASGINPPGTTAPATPAQYKIAASYVWQGMTEDYQLASNWAPHRTVPDASDMLVFDGAVVAADTIDNIPSETITKLSFINGINATLNGAAANTLTVNGATTATNLLVETGTTLSLGTTTSLSLSFGATTGQVGTIAGTLNINGGSTVNTANSVTTVTGTVSVNGTASLTGTATTLIVGPGATYTHNRNGGTVSAATYHPTSTIIVSGVVSSTSMTMPSKPGNLIWNCAAQTTNLSFSSTIDTVFGNLTIISTGTGRVELGNSPNVQVMGDFTQIDGTFAVGNNTSGSGFLEVLGSTYLNGGTFLLNSAASGTASYQLKCYGNLYHAAANTISKLNSLSGAPATIIFSGTSAQQVNTSGAITNNISYQINNPAGVVLTGILPVNANATNTISAGQYSGTGVFSYDATSSTLVYSGAASMTATAFEYPATNGPVNLTVAVGAGNQLTLPFSRTVGGTLTMTSGDINIGSNNLTLGTSAASTGSLAFTSGAIRVTTGTFTRWFGTTGMPATPVGSTGLFPLAYGANSRSVHIYSAAQATSGGTVTIGHNNVPGTTAINLFDPPTQLDQRTNTSWTVSTGNGFAMAGATLGLRVTAGNMFTSVTPADLRLIQASSAAGTAITGSGTFPNYLVSRSDLSLANFSQTHYIGAPAGNIQTIFNSIASGNWASGATWDAGAAPGSSDYVTISSGHTVTVNSNATAANLTVQNGGALATASGTLTVGNSIVNNGTFAVTGGTVNYGPAGGGNKLFANNGTLDVSGGTLNINGNLINATGSVFNQSGGNINIDGNDGTAAGSVAITSDLLGFGTSSSSNVGINVTGGNITIVDPHFAGTATATAGAALAFRATSSAGRTFGTAHTTTFGGNSGTNASTATFSFFVDCYVNSSQLVLGNVVINSGAGRKVITDAVSGGGGLNVGGNLVINAGSELIDTTMAAQGITLSGNLTNNGILTQVNTSGLRLISLTGAANTTQGAVANSVTIGGTGIFRNTAGTTTASFNGLTVNNTSATGAIIDGFNPVLAGNLNLTAGVLNIEDQHLTVGTAPTPSVDIIGSGTIRVTTGTVTRWFSTSNLPTSPANSGAGYFPISAAGGNRAVSIYGSAQPSSAGTITVGHTDATGLSAVSVTDGNYNIEKRTNAYWNITTGNGFAVAGSTMGLRVTAGNLLDPGANAANLRLTQGSSVAGTHVAGSGAAPNFQASRTDLSLANFTQPHYVGGSNADLNIANPPVFTLQPGSDTVCAGAAASFKAATQAAAAYQWQTYSNGAWSNIAASANVSGETTDSLTILNTTSFNGNGFRLKATANGLDTYSDSVGLTVITVTASGSQTNVSCYNGNNGTATVVASGGSSPYTYSWTGTTAATASATGLSAGSYSVLVTDNNGCTASANFTITQPAAAVSGSTVVTNVTCNGGANGSINLTPSGGTAPYTFNWGGGVTTEDRTGLSAGSYSVIVTDANGCTGTVNATVTQPATAVSGSTIVTSVSCNGGSDGAINLTASGGTAPYTYNWGGGVTTEDRTGLSAGSYSVTITDANGCTATVNASVSQPAAAVSGSTVVTNVSCNGGSNGTINLTPAGGTAPYTYNWGGGITTEDRTGLAAGAYSVVITDGNGCTATVNVTISQPAAAVSGTTVTTNVSCFGGSNGSINLTPSGGTAPYTFDWGGGITTEDRTGLAAGSYTVTITDANGCTGTANATVTQPTVALSGSTTVTNVSCFGGTNGSINLTPAGGTAPYTYNWGGGITTEDRTGLAAGSYTVVITDANGCTATANATVTQPLAIVSGTTVVTNVSCFGGNNGSINLTPAGGTAPYTYDWGGGITTEDRTGLAAGTYTVIITDANGCTGTANATVSQPAAIVSGTTLVTNVSCFGGSNGTINLTPAGGTGPYTYNWGGGVTTEDRTGLSAGSYSVTITDANGCTASVNATVSQPAAAVSGSTVVTNVTCNGGANGSINLTPSGGTAPYTFNWGGGVTTEDRTGLSAGSYSVVVTDANGCTGTVNATVTQPATAVSGSTIVTSVSCNGGSDGAINLTASGGTAPYTYNWGGGVTTEDRTGLSAGSYSVTITDANGCTATVNASVTEPQVLANNTITGAQTICINNTPAVISGSTPTGGPGAYSYLWESSTTGATTGFSAAAGTNNTIDYIPGALTQTTWFRRTVTSGTCTDVSAAVAVTVNPAVSITTQPAAGTTLCEGSYIALSVSATNATGYQWRKNGNALSNGTKVSGATSASLLINNVTVSDAGSYDVVVTGQTGCVNDTSNASTFTVNSLGNSLAANNSTDNANHLDGLDIIYTDANCNPIAMIDDGNGGNTLGTVTATVNVASSVQTANGQPYVQRSYVITPANNGAATVTLYATQAEFNAYNAAASGYPQLPSGGADNGNVKVTKFSGNTLGSGTATLITPTSVVWNSSANYWEITIPVSGFSSFFIHSGSFPLDVQLLSLSAANQGATNRIDWSTSNERDMSRFELERSTDGNNYSLLGAVPAKNTASSYSYTDAQPITGTNYYRLKMIAVNGDFSYSKVVSANAGNKGFAMESFPNPAAEHVTVRISGTIAGKATIQVIDLNGKVVRTAAATGNETRIDLEGLAGGIYTIRYTDDVNSGVLRISVH